MKDEIAAKLGAIAEDRWGVFTTDQAERAGIKRKHLARMASSGALERLTQGVYRMPGAPRHPHQEVLVAWMALGGWRARPRAVPPVVVAGEAAATIHGLGDFYVDEIDLIVPSRRGTRREGIRLRTRNLEEPDIVYVDSVAVLSPEKMIADLIENSTDMSLVSDVIDHAQSKGIALSETRLAAHLNPLARRHGYAPDDGERFAAELMGSAS